MTRSKNITNHDIWHLEIIKKVDPLGYKLYLDRPLTVLMARPVSLTGGVMDSGPQASSNHSLYRF